MANLKEIRNRIASVSSTMQITSAMKMVSAAKLKKAQDAITAIRPYSDKLTELIQDLSASADTDQPNPFAVVRQEEKILLVAITSNRGLCGAFNTNVIKETLRLSKEEFEGKTVELVTIGKKGSDILSKSLPFKSSHDDVFDDLTFENTAKIAKIIMEAFVGSEYDKVILIYNRFKNAATQLITVEPFLPIVSESSEEETSNGDYIFEPSQAEIINELLKIDLNILLPMIENYIDKNRKSSQSMIGIPELLIAIEHEQVKPLIKTLVRIGSGELLMEISNVISDSKQDYSFFINKDTIIKKSQELAGVIFQNISFIYKDTFIAKDNFIKDYFKYKESEEIECLLRFSCILLKDEPIDSYVHSIKNKDTQVPFIIEVIEHKLPESISSVLVPIIEIESSTNQTKFIFLFYTSNREDESFCAHIFALVATVRQFRQC